MKVYSLIILSDCKLYRFILAFPIKPYFTIALVAANLPFISTDFINE